ncbi:hypothetical protein LA336_03490 [Clostridium sporogenes]|nr:hypothetical protein [Clostridium sporogenes]UBI12666.1 hypothetical protein LA336_03490 [Clostridium sporogenes]
MLAFNAFKVSAFIESFASFKSIGAFNWYESGATANESTRFASAAADNIAFP